MYSKKRIWCFSFAHHVCPIVIHCLHSIYFTQLCNYYLYPITTHWLTKLFISHYFPLSHYYPQNRSSIIYHHYIPLFPSIIPLLSTNRFPIIIIENQSCSTKKRLLDLQQQRRILLRRCHQRRLRKFLVRRGTTGLNSRCHDVAWKLPGTMENTLW